MKLSGFNLLLLGSLFVLTIGSVPAQTLDLQQLPNDKIQLGVNVQKPFFHNYYSSTTWNATYRLFVNFPVNPKTNLLINIPFINNNYTHIFSQGYYPAFYIPANEEKGFGNIFIGIQTNRPLVDNKRSVYTFGVYLPTASESASYTGSYSDYYYLPFYIPHIVGGYFNYSYHRTNVEGLNYGLELGPDYIISTQKGGGTQLLLHYGIIAGYNFGKILLSAEFNGRFSLSGYSRDLSDRFLNLAGFGAQWNGGFITPKVFYKIYLKKDFSDTISGVLGAGISFAIDK